MRIVSLLPSATEIVCELGLQDQLVGVTRGCDYPPSVVGKPIVSRGVLGAATMTSAEIDAAVQARHAAGEGTYQLDVEQLVALAPDLILTQGLCDVCAVSHAEVCEAATALTSEPKILSLNPTHLTDVLSNVKTIGDFTGRQAEARALITRLRTRLDRIALAVAAVKQPVRAFCLEWLDPPWSAGHWVPEMVGLAGGVDGLASAGLPSRRLSWSEVAEYAPETVILLPCGYDLTETLANAAKAEWPPEWWSLPAVQQGRVWAVDGSGYFNRSGPRLFDGVALLAAAFHPELEIEDVPAGAYCPVPLQR
jgi:iron complex transport system substrate-binding protein